MSLDPSKRKGLHVKASYYDAVGYFFQTCWLLQFLLKLLTVGKKINLGYQGKLPGLLNISNILLVMINPPVMLIDETRVARAAKEVAVLLGSIPPPINTNPPAAVMPDMALVTDMSGE